MYLHFIPRAIRSQIIFIFLVASLCGSTLAQASFTSVTVAGKDLNEAMVIAVRTAIQSQMTKERQPSRAWVDAEIAPYAAQLVNSYKIASESAGAVTIHADVEMDTIRAILALQPKQLGLTEKEPKALLLYRVAGIDARTDMGNLKLLDSSIRDRFTRRKFTPIMSSGENAEEQLVTPESILLPDLVRGEAQRQGAQLAFSLVATAGVQENENTHREEEKWFLQAQLLEVSKTRVLAKVKTAIPSPTTQKKEEVARYLLIRGDELLHELFIKAGERFLVQTDNNNRGGILVRVKNPPNFAAVNAFRQALEANKEIRSLQEQVVLRGSYEFLAKTSLNPAALAAKVRSLSVPGFAIILEQENPDIVLLRLEAQAAPATDAGEKSP